MLMSQYLPYELQSIVGTLDRLLRNNLVEIPPNFQEVPKQNMPSSPFRSLLPQQRPLHHQFRQILPLEELPVYQRRH